MGICGGVEYSRNGFEWVNAIKFLYELNLWLVRESAYAKLLFLPKYDTHLRRPEPQAMRLHQVFATFAVVKTYFIPKRQHVETVLRVCVDLEVQKEIRKERQLEELRYIQQQAGLISVGERDRLEWMYKVHNAHQQIRTNTQHTTNVYQHYTYTNVQHTPHDYCYFHSRSVIYNHLKPSMQAGSSSNVNL